MERNKMFRYETPVVDIEVYNINNKLEIQVIYKDTGKKVKETYNSTDVMQLYGLLKGYHTISEVSKIFIDIEDTIAKVDVNSLPMLAAVKVKSFDDMISMNDTDRELILGSLDTLSHNEGMQGLLNIEIKENEIDVKIMAIEGLLDKGVELLIRVLHTLVSLGRYKVVVEKLPKDAYTNKEQREEILKNVRKQREKCNKELLDIFGYNKKY